MPTLPQYDSASIQQMAGRAGRKGFDTEGKVIVITEDTNVDMYRKIMVLYSGSAISLHALHSPDNRLLFLNDQMSSLFRRVLHLTIIPPWLLDFRAARR